MGPTEDPWLRCYQRVDDPSLRLVCLPHAGGSASAFRNWPQLLAPAIEMHAVRYPGREDRLGEPCLTELTELADQVTAAVLRLPAGPLALFGHSMGASVAHEATVRLERAGRPVSMLFVSGRAAPHRLRPTRLGAGGSDEDLLAEVRRLDPRSGPLLTMPGIEQLVLPAIRGDYRLLSSYSAHQPTTVRAPIVGYAGTDDPEVPVAEVASWREVSSTSFELRTFDGSHFFLAAAEAETEVVADLGSRLTGLAG